MNAADFLANVSIFSHLKKDDLQRIGEQVRYCSFKRGDVIFREGERDARLFILISGKVEVIKSYGTKKEKHLRTMESPCYFGEMALIGDLVRSATVVARANTETLCLDQWNLHQEIERHPALAIELLRMLHRRLLALEKTLINAVGGIITICANCKKIPDENGAWLTIDQFIMDHTDYEFSHGICPECIEKLYPETIEHH